MQTREYTLHFIESETEWEHNGNKPINRGGKRDVNRSVKFESSSVATARNIAIGFAQFFEPDFVPAPWEQINRTHTTNRRDQSRYNESGRQIYNRRIEICLVDLTEFERARQEQKHGKTRIHPVFQIAEHLHQTEAREKELGYCRHCNTDTEKIRVYPYELFPFGYHGTIAAYVCLICGNF